MRFPKLIRLERKATRFRDAILIKPIAKSRLVQRHAHDDYDFAIKVLDDHKIAFDPSDHSIGREIRKTGTWQRDDFRLVISQLHRAGKNTGDKIFLDVGANIGTQTVYALVQNDFARAICFEPVPANLAVLDMNVALNNLSERVTIFRKAAGSKSETKTLNLERALSGNHSFHSEFNSREAKIDVEVTTVDLELSKLKIQPQDVGLFWLDVEGFEPEAISGASGLIEAGVPLCVEFNARLYGEEQKANLLEKISRYYSFVWSVKDGPRSLGSVPSGSLTGDLLFY